jgi:hypothetical protein
MLKKLLTLLGGSSTVSSSATEPGASPAEQALLRQIAERSKTDPLIGAKLGGKEVTQRVITAMKTERGIHIESLLCALGAVAGYSCQAAVRAIATSRGLPTESLLQRVETTDGQVYFFGDNLNKPLAESQYSVWGLAGGAAQQAGCASLPDVDDIFKHVSSTVGTPNFGAPRIAQDHRPHDAPLNYVRVLWPALRPVISKFCPNPEHWPILVSMSIYEVIGMGKSVLDPCLAIRLVMESAIPMSKVKLDAT